MTRSFIRTSIATLALIATATAAHAQAGPPAGKATPAPAATTPPPAATAPATPTPTTPRAATTSAPAQQQPVAFGGGRNTAPTAQAARALYDNNLKTRQANCSSKGAIYKWVPPHAVGDANTLKGGYYASSFGGGCRKVGLGEAIANGAVTVRGQ